MREIADLGYGFVPTTPDRLWSALGRLPLLSPDATFAWRGVSDSSFAMESSLHRALAGEGSPTEATLRDAEKTMIRQARTWGLGQERFTHFSDLHLLALLQHHGLPTRLLDVTSDPTTALWFACSGSPERDGLLAAFDISDYPQVTSGDPAPQTMGAQYDPLGWQLQHLLEVSEREQRPFVVKTGVRDARMAAQNGFFLSSACPPPGQQHEYREVPRPDVNGIYLRASGYIPGDVAERCLFAEEREVEKFPLALWALIVPAAHKRQVLRALETTFDRTASRLFPDFAGFKSMGWRHDG